MLLCHAVCRKQEYAVAAGLECVFQQACKQTLVQPDTDDGSGMAPADQPVTAP